MLVLRLKGHKNCHASQEEVNKFAKEGGNCQNPRLLCANEQGVRVNDAKVLVQLGNPDK